MSIAIRAARAGDLPRIQAIVAAAYARYIARMGKKPGPMLDDYRARIEAGEAWVAESGGAIWL